MILTLSFGYLSDLLQHIWFFHKIYQIFIIPQGKEKMELMAESRDHVDGNDEL